MRKICDEFAEGYDMKFDSSKSVTTRIDDRHKVNCEPLTFGGSHLQFVPSLKYLWVQFLAAKKLTCSFDNVATTYMYGYIE